MENKKVNKYYIAIAAVVFLVGIIWAARQLLLESSVVVDTTEIVQKYNVVEVTELSSEPPASGDVVLVPVAGEIDTANWESFTSEVFGITFQYPPDWITSFDSEVNQSLEIIHPNNTDSLYGGDDLTFSINKIQRDLTAESAWGRDIEVWGVRGRAYGAVRGLRSYNIVILPVNDHFIELRSRNIDELNSIFVSLLSTIRFQ